jgi:hypothetical protein
MVLLVILTPPLLDEILLKIIMHIKISHKMVCMKKAYDAGSTLLRPHGLTHQVIYGIHLILYMFILNNHGMHDHASIYDVRKDLLILKLS